MSEQKFKYGDLVMIAKDLGKHMSHFTSNCPAIVLYSYFDKYGGCDDKNKKQYGIFIDGSGRHTWYYEHQLTLVESNRSDLLEKWQYAIDEHIKQTSNIDWIFKNGKEVFEKGCGESLHTLYFMLGGGSLWGARGQAYTYYRNSVYTLSLVEPFLKSGDKEGWITFCTEFKNMNKIKK